jgi:predicted CXXCH cytochrome family protein
MAMLLALPAMANAWYLNAKSANTTQGTVTPSGTATVATGASSAEYTVTPKTTAYKISKVTLDGAVLAPNANGKYVAPYDAAKAYRYLVAYFTANTTYYNITTTAGANGAVYEDTYESLTNIPAGANRQILVVPNTGYSIADLTVSAGGVTTDTANGKLVTFSSLAADQSVSATFALTPVRTVDAGSDITINNTLSGSLFGAATSNQGTITYAWTGAGLTFGTANKATTTVSAAAVGTYTATLSATSNGVTVTDDVVVTFGTDNSACTSCHAGSTPRTVAEAGTNVCVSCHTSDAHGDFATWQQANDYKAGMHAAASGHTTGKCQRCHTSDGAINGATVGWTGGYAEVLSPVAYTAVTAADGISCAACHNHTNGLRAVNTTVAGAVVAWDPNGNGVVDQYDECTQCHSLTNNSGALVGNYHDGSSASVERTISDSHFDDPTTAVVEGYNLRKNTANTCADCHNLHKADVTIQEEWAESGHAGKIAVAKTAALEANSILYYGAAAGTDPYTLRPGSTRTYIEDYKRTTAAAANGTPSANALLKTIGPDPLEAFVHYNWTQTTGTGNRATCEKCHTATGAANYMNNPAAYVPANNDFSHISGWTATAGSNSKELLYCWGCHSDSQTGALRNPGAVVADYKFQGAPAVFPNVGPSNTCLTCHVGQASGNSITDLTAAGNTFVNQSFVNSHYMAAGSLMYAKGGYTNFVPASTNAGTMSYGQSLTSDADQTVDVNGVAVAGKLTSTHRKLGTSAINGDSHNPAFFVAGNLDSDGPCATCHYAGADHTLELGQKAIDGVCSKCHEVTDQAGLEEFLEVEGSAPFEAAINLALAKLSANYNITYNQAAYPYFYDVSAANGAVKNWTRSNFLATPLTAADAEKLMGAAFNINLLQRDPAAYAHARTYARRLLFDTIDFLDDGIMNMSAADTAAASGITDANGNLVFVKGLTANDPATTEAYKYLAGYNRTSGAWNAVARP